MHRLTAIITPCYDRVLTNINNSLCNRDHPVALGRDMHSFEKYLLATARRSQSAATGRTVLLLLAASAGALLYAPRLMPESNAWLAHGTSESAAQGVSGAWLARFGFVCFGLAVVWLTGAGREAWARGAVVLHAAFGVLMVSTAAFSVRPWDANWPFDPVEDFLHSVTATAMGFAFAFGVLLLLLKRGCRQSLARAIDIMAILAATFLPLAMLVWREWYGLLQRLMFAVAYLWYAHEAIRLYSRR